MVRGVFEKRLAELSAGINELRQLHQRMQKALEALAEDMPDARQDGLPSAV